MNAIRGIAFGFGILVVDCASSAPVVTGSNYEERLYKTCSSVSFCLASFSQIPAGKTVVVTNVGCFAAVTKSVQSSLLGVSSTANTYSARHQYFPMQLMSRSSSNSLMYYSAQAPIRAAMASGFPYVAVSLIAAGTHTLDCTISGEISSD
jgi:hypothetical protein